MELTSVNGIVTDFGLLALVNSYDLLEISVRTGSAAAALGIGPGAPVQTGGA